MFFEGPEKKFELRIQTDEQSFLDFPREFYLQLVHKAQAEILSEITNSHLQAYLLSESSLFVWKDRVLMITCGQTNLANAANFLLKEINLESVDHFFYQRKNEFKAKLQPTSFDDDCNLLSQSLKGQAWRFGPEHGHHNSVFAYKNNSGLGPDFDTPATELFVYDLTQSVCSGLIEFCQAGKGIAEFFGLQKHFPNYQLDEHYFRPAGYSINGINEESYFSIHITPQWEHSYVSLETNDPSIESRGTIEYFLERLNGGEVDLVKFGQHESGLPTIQNYQMKEQYYHPSLAGQKVHFGHFFKTNRPIQSAVQLN